MTVRLGIPGPVCDLRRPNSVSSMSISSTARWFRLRLRLIRALVPVAAIAVALNTHAPQVSAAAESGPPLLDYRVASAEAQPADSIEDHYVAPPQLGETHPLDAFRAMYAESRCRVESPSPPCDETCMPPCAVGCDHACPRGYAWVEGLVLTRDNDSANRPLVLDVNTDEVLLTTGDLDFNWSGGLRAGFGHRLHDCWGAELAYLCYFDTSAVAGAASPDDLALPGDLGLVVNNFFMADQVDVRYTSLLNSAEASFVHCCGDCNHSLEWLAGFRYIDLSERITMTAFDSAESTTTYRVKATNDLYGAQLGARTRYRTGCWSWEATTKGGVYGNFMEQRQAPIIDFPDFEFRSARGGSESDVAFVGDLNLTSIYQITRVWGLRAGYNLIWIEDVALAPAQLDFTNVAGSGTGLATGDSLFLHGANFGIEARW